MVPHPNRPVRRCGTAAPKSNIATRRIKPEIESLEAYTVQPTPPKTQPDYTLPALCIGITAVALAGFGILANASFMATVGAPGFRDRVWESASRFWPWGCPLAAILAARGDRHSATVAWCTWVPCVAARQNSRKFTINGFNRLQVPAT
jgi:hypothetical protein